MTELILPQHLRRQHRPYAGASTQSLLEELLAREEVAELSLQQVLPTLDQTQDPNATRSQMLATMFQQAGMAIASSGFAFTAMAQQPDVLNPSVYLDVLIAKILIVRHPAIPQPAPVIDVTPVVPHANNP